MSAVSHMMLLSKGGAFNPSQAGTLAAWYRSDQGITISTGVSQWNDLSGNARHLTQATSGNQPTYGATSGANSLPGLTFSGSPVTMATTFTAINQPIHAFMILKTTGIGSANRAWLAGGSSSERFLVDDTANRTFTYFGTTGISYTHSDTTNFFLWEILVNNASSSVIRGSTAATSGTVGTSTLSGISLGFVSGLGYGPGIISELAVYPSQISGSNLTNLRAYFASRYAVATN